MTNTPTQIEYWAEVRELAALYADPEARDDPDQDADKWLHETLDGYEWIIYTAEARHVLIHSEHPEALTDELGEVVNFNRPEPGAYFAMMADVRQEAGR